MGIGGDVQARYGISRRFSVGGALTLERLKTGQDPVRQNVPFPYLKLNARSMSLLGWAHLLAGDAVAPYVFSGVGVMWFSRATHLAYYPDPGVKSSLQFPLGIGVETFSKKGLSFDFNLSYVLFNDQTDALRNGLPDGALNARFGLNLYLGSSDDDDDDNDGLTNVEEETIGTNPTNPDTDEDGLFDGAEIRRYKTNPFHADSDRDRLRDGEEVLQFFSDPNRSDTDGDGFSDGDEVATGTDPLDKDRHP